MKVQLDYFSSNSKTGFSSEVSICPLMKKVKGKYVALCGVKKCYAVTRFNSMMGKGIEKKMLNLSDREVYLDSEINFINSMNKQKPVLMRSFSFGDFHIDKKDTFFKILRDLEVDRHIVISKTIWLYANKGELSMKDLIYISNNSILSLGFTKQLYPKFKKFMKKFSGVKFSIAYTSNTADEIEWLKNKDPELFEIVDIFHDHKVHYNAIHLDNPKKDKAIKRHLKAIKDIDLEASQKLCNLFGGASKKTGCLNCNGCANISRFKDLSLEGEEIA